MAAGAIIATYVNLNGRVKFNEERHGEKIKDLEKRQTAIESRQQTLESELVQKIKEFEIMLTRIDERLAIYTKRDMG